LEDRWAYTDAKSEVILDIMEDAERWAADPKRLSPPGASRRPPRQAGR
jgi:hypothetical protein